MLTGDVHARVRCTGRWPQRSPTSECPVWWRCGTTSMSSPRPNSWPTCMPTYLPGALWARPPVRPGKPWPLTPSGRSAQPRSHCKIGLCRWCMKLPLVLVRPSERAAPLVKLTLTETTTGDGSAEPAGLPQPPDAGFFGRDETLLALDRAFDTQQIVLLHAYAGAGKSATAAEFARWYHVTGGLDHPDHPERSGAVLWSSFEHHLTADRVIGAAGDHFARVLKANGILWKWSPTRRNAGISACCRCWGRCRCCGCGTTSSQ